MIQELVKKIICNEDKQLMQEDLKSIYNWAKNNKMQFNAGNFEQIFHRNTKNSCIEPYKSSSGDPITVKSKEKDLGVLSTNNLLLQELMGMLLRTFSTREKQPMMRMFNTYFKSKMEYCYIPLYGHQ